MPLPDLIKLDTQGSERLILSASPECVKNASVIFTETWLMRGYGPETPLLTELMDLLHPSGYRLAELGYRFYNSDHELYGCDALFVKVELLRRIASCMPRSSW